MGQHHGRHRSGPPHARRAALRPDLPAAYSKRRHARWARPSAGAIWLSPEKTSPYQFYQYWINVDDADAGKLPAISHRAFARRDRIARCSLAPSSRKRESQKRLAEELTRLVHGELGLAAARKATEIFFGAEIENLNDTQLIDIFADVPSQELPRERLAGDGLPLIDAFVESGLAKSKGEARRTIAQGGAYVNNRPR